MISYRIIKLKKNLRILLRTDTKPFRLLTQEQIDDLNKRLKSPQRIQRIRDNYLETKRLQEKLKHQRLQEKLEEEKNKIKLKRNLGKDMASSYLELINGVLRDLNEVELTTNTFSASRGVQTAVKDYVNRGIDDIINADTEWPFTVTAKSFTTTAGTRLYTRSALSVTDTKTVDFDSFTFLEASDKKETTLEYITYSEYLDNYHERDTDPTGNSRAIPVYVYQDPQNNIGLSPVPDKATYTVKYYYYSTHTALSGSTDTSLIPTRFENVIIERAKYYAFTLRGDVQNAQLAQMQFDKSIKRMRVELINKQLYMRAV